jgi:hypothetical protein
LAGENIAASSRGTAISVFSLWRTSPGHNANLLGAYTATGLGATPGFPSARAGITATQMFGRSRAQGGDTGLDLYYPNEPCRAAKVRRGAVKARTKASRKGSSRRTKLRRKLKRAGRAVARTCSQPVQAPLL